MKTNNPFMQGGESTHEYKGRSFIVDYYPDKYGGGTWQCCDSGHIVRGRAQTKSGCIEEAHKDWDEYSLTPPKK